MSIEWETSDPITGFEVYDLGARCRFGARYLSGEYPDLQAELQRITLDGQRKATIKAADARRPTIQVLGREVTIKGFTVTGGSFGIAINRGGTAVVDTPLRNCGSRGLPQQLCAHRQQHDPRQHAARDPGARKFVGAHRRVVHG